MDRQNAQPLTVDEAKLLFRLSVGAAAAGPLGMINAKRLTLAAFGVGLTLGLFPATRKALGVVLTRYLSSMQ